MLRSSTCTTVFRVSSSCHCWSEGGWSDCMVSFRKQTFEFFSIFEFLNRKIFEKKLWIILESESHPYLWENLDKLTI